MKLENTKNMLATQFAIVEVLEHQLTVVREKVEEQQKAAPVCVACASKTPMCLICFEQRADIACDPCGHLCYCQKCKKFSNCPQCRQPTDKYLRVYNQSP
jgi:hypothetical protein